MARVVPRRGGDGAGDEHLRGQRDRARRRLGLWPGFALAGFLRAAWLNEAVAPIFIVILGGVSALAILAWRTLFWVFGKWRKDRAS